MKNKIVSSAFIFILATILAVSAVSALSLIPSAGTIDLSPTALSQNLTITGNGQFNLTSTYPYSTSIKDSNNKEIPILVNLISLNKTDINSATFSITATNNNNFVLGEKFSTPLIISAVNSTNSTDTTTSTVSLTFENNNFCSLGNKGGNLSITSLKLDNVGGLGDDNEWYPLDNIEAEVKVENNGNDKISDIIVEWGVYNPKTGNWVIKEEEKKFSLKDGKKQTLTIDFQINPKDLDTEMDDNFIFYAKAYSDDLGEDTECVSDSESVSITMENDFVVLNDIVVPETASCGDSIQITAYVWNVGTDDQTDVSVNIYNKILGINEKVNVGDIDSLESGKLDVTIKLPEKIDEKSYPIAFYVYDDSGDIYQNNNDDDSSKTVNLKIGTCEVKTNKAVVSAEIVSGGKAGEKLIIKSTLTNTGSASATYKLNAAAYAGWASSVSLDKSTVTLDAGKSAEVVFTFDVKEDASGEQSFDIEALSDNEVVVKQPVSVTIEKSASKFSLTGAITGDNWYLWAIGVINVVLIFIIISVAVRVAKK